MVVPVGGVAMTKRVPVESAPGPLEDYAARFDDIFSNRAQSEGFRRYLEGLLLADERNKTLTALANTEPVIGAQRKEAQSLQWFLTESSWDPEEVNRRRVELMLEDPQTAAQEGGALVIDETGDRKDGKATAHVGKQYLGGIGKVDNGVVSVSSLYADERLYYPLEVEPYTPEHHFKGGKKDPEFRTKLQIAWELVEQALEMKVPFRAVVADSLYGENLGFRETLLGSETPYVMALGPSHAWLAFPDQVGNVWEVALFSTVSSWGGPEDPGEWVRLERTFRDGRIEQWWALEAQGGPYGGPESSERLVVVTTDPATLPDRSTSYLVTNLPAPGSERAQRSQHSAATLAEVARLYALRGWIEQSYKQVKNSLGWAHYQVRKDLSIRRHWQLVCCAFSFCWWACTECKDVGSPPIVVLKDSRYSSIVAAETNGGEKEARDSTAIMAASASEGESVAAAVRNAAALLASVLRSAPARRAQGVAR